MKKIYLIHGWSGSPTSEPWFSWLIKECEKREIKIEILKMPNTNEPKIEEWVGHLEKICDLTEETYFVGHSIGCQTIMRFMEKLPEEKKISGVCFVAGFFNLLETGWESEDEGGIKAEKRIAEPWLKTPINFEKVKFHTNNILAIFSNDDPCVPVSDSKLFEEKLNAKIIILTGEEHFNETKEIPEILKIFEK